MVWVRKTAKETGNYKTEKIVDKGGLRDISGHIVGGHKLVCNPCQKSDHHAQRYEASTQARVHIFFISPPLCVHIRY